MFCRVFSIVISRFVEINKYATILMATHVMAGDFYICTLYMRVREKGNVYRIKVQGNGTIAHDGCMSREADMQSLSHSEPLPLQSTNVFQTVQSQFL